MEIRAKYGWKRVRDLASRLKEPKLLESVLNNLRLTAIRLEKGHNENGILIEYFDNGQPKGRVYANPDEFLSNEISYLYFEYFGTGMYAEKEHIGTTKHFIDSGFTEWFIPVEKAPRPLNYPTIVINDTEFYIAHGVKGNHFLTDAEFETREQNKQLIAETMEQIFREVCN